MASFLLDENVSPIVAEQIVSKDPLARVSSMQRFRGGELLGVEDEAILQVAFQEKLTLITFDLSTIKPLLKTWADEGRSHAGVIFIDDKTIAGNDYGVLTMAILQVWNRLKDIDFTDGVLFLQPDSRT